MTSNTFLTGCKLSVSGLVRTARSTAADSIRSAGGEFTSDLTKDCTHLIVTPAAALERSDKFKAALQWKMWVVSIDWLNASIKAGNRLNEELYAFKEPTTAPTAVVESLSSTATTVTIEQKQSITSAPIVEITGAIPAPAPVPVPAPAPAPAPVPVKSQLHPKPKSTHTDNNNNNNNNKQLLTPVLTPVTDPINSILPFKPPQTAQTVRANSTGTVTVTTAGSGSLSTIPIPLFGLTFDLSIDLTADTLFDPCEISLIGLSPIDEIFAIDCIRAGGGTRYIGYRSNSTHIVAPSLSIVQQSIAAASAAANNNNSTTTAFTSTVTGLSAINSIPIVNLEWLADCIKQQKLLPTSKYILTNTATTTAAAGPSTLGFDSSDHAATLPIPNNQFNSNKPLSNGPIDFSSFNNEINSNKLIRTKTGLDNNTLPIRTHSTINNNTNSNNNQLNKKSNSIINIIINNNSNNNNNNNQSNELKSVFINRTFYCHQIRSLESRSILFASIRQLGGIIKEEFDIETAAAITDNNSNKNRVDYIVCESIDAELRELYLKQSPSNRNRIIFILPQYIDQCMHFRKRLSANQLQFNPLPNPNCSTSAEFTPLRITVSGFSDIYRSQLQLIIESLGSSYTAGLKKSNTHLIASNPIGAKYNKAKLDKRIIVKPEWINQCLRTLTVVDTALYQYTEAEELAAAIKAGTGTGTDSIDSPAITVGTVNQLETETENDADADQNDQPESNETTVATAADAAADADADPDTPIINPETAINQHTDQIDTEPIDHQLQPQSDSIMTDDDDIGTVFTNKLQSAVRKTTIKAANNKSNAAAAAAEADNTNTTTTTATTTATATVNRGRKRNSTVLDHTESNNIKQSNPEPKSPLISMINDSNNAETTASTVESASNSRNRRTPSRSSKSAIVADGGTSTSTLSAVIESTDEMDSIHSRTPQQQQQRRQQKQKKSNTNTDTNTDQAQSPPSAASKANKSKPQYKPGGTPSTTTVAPVSAYHSPLTSAQRQSAALTAHLQSQIDSISPTGYRKLTDINRKHVLVPTELTEEDCIDPFAFNTSPNTESQGNNRSTASPAAAASVSKVIQFTPDRSKLSKKQSKSNDKPINTNTPVSIVQSKSKVKSAASSASASASATKPAASICKQFYLAFSCVKTVDKDQLMKLKLLKTNPASVLAFDSNNYSEISHTLTDEFKRSEKVIIAIVSGSRLLSADWIRDSNEFGYFINEIPYEWSSLYHSQLINTTISTQGLALLAAADRWKLNRPFNDWIVYCNIGSNSNNSDSIAKHNVFQLFLTKGGATVTSVFNPNNSNINYTHIFLGESYLTIPSNKRQLNSIFKYCDNNNTHLLHYSYITDYVFIELIEKLDYIHYQINPGNINNIWPSSAIHTIGNAIPSQSQSQQQQQQQHSESITRSTRTHPN